MTEYTKRIRETEEALVRIINGSSLPPAVIRLILTNIIKDVTNIELQEEDKKIEEAVENGNN